LEDVAGMKIAEAMMKNDQIRVVHMASNKLSSETSELMVDVLKKN